ncbi:hypothetical protein DL764_007583 [Monosporascus ibericus]|uniref:Ubiquitin carrier protein n=1 Tax=Monosporascus ibericus TaxID=155417 RepID=A0A4Q4T377_9PEZI|nr:hypothetical protein DL764_007583 [Monosporascus ibericus]
MYRDIAHAVYRRGEASMDGYQLPGWGWGLLFLDIIVFLPAILVVSYTLQSIYPVLAMIEDPSPPAYEPVSLNGDTQSLPDDMSPVADEAARGSKTRAITASIRATHRTLYGISGWISYFRGFACYVAMSVGTMFIYSVMVGTFVPSLIAAPICAVALVQLYTAWVHIVISAPSPKPFWRRLAPFKKTFQATALPIVVYFLAIQISGFVPTLLGRALGLPQWKPNQPGAVPDGDVNDIWKGLIVLIVSLVLKVFLVIPVHVVLTRVQASLLPEEDETIVPFDRSFQGTVEPVIVGGKGFVSPMDAWKTFSRASWVRLVKLYVKIFLVGLALCVAWMVVIVPELVVIFRYAKKIE